MNDPAHGYEQHAAGFQARRDKSTVGVTTVLQWADSLPAGARLLDIGCGSGRPLAVALAAAGFEIYGVDASPSLCAAFRRNLPGAPIACEAAEDSRFFGETFPAALMVGLLFLLPAAAQPGLLRHVAGALAPGGQLLVAAPTQAGTWQDMLTARESVSLGRSAYVDAIAAAGLELVSEYDDSGGNHYYATRAPA